MKRLQAATPQGRKTAIIMLILTGTYLVFELGFNARLLDVVGGTATPDEVDHIETYGRIISGVALTLLVWGGQIKTAIAQQTSTPALLFRLVLSAIFCIFVMYHGQKILIDTLADNSTADTRARSAVLVPISHLIKTDNFHLAQMDVEPAAYSTPEGKTFIATFALQALAVPKLYKTVNEQADSVFRMSVVGGRGAVEHAHSDFQKSVTALKSRFVDDYQPGVRKYDAAIRGISNEQRSAWTDYKNSLVYRGVFGRARLIEPGRVPQGKWPEVRRTLQGKGVEVGNNWRPDDIGAFNQAIDTKIRREAKAAFEKESKAALKSDIAVAPGLNFAQWLDTAPIQKQWRESLGVPAGLHLTPDMPIDEYEAKVYEPTIEADVARVKKERLAPVEQYADGAKYEAIGKDSARALMVPPIALTFSLLGAFTHILKCALFVVKIFVAIPKALFAATMVLYLLAVLTVPFAFPNEITRQKLVTTLAGHTTAALGPLSGTILNFGSHWVMLMQRYFYPVNEAVRTGLLQGFTYGYQDGESAETGGVPVKTATSPGKTHDQVKSHSGKSPDVRVKESLFDSLLAWPGRRLDDYRATNLQKQ